MTLQQGNARYTSLGTATVRSVRISGSQVIAKLEFRGHTRSERLFTAPIELVLEAKTEAQQETVIRANTSAERLIVQITGMRLAPLALRLIGALFGVRNIWQRDSGFLQVKLLH